MGRPAEARSGQRRAKPTRLPRQRSTQAFTLLELMITTAVLSLLTAVAFPRFQQARNSALIGSIVAELNRC